MSSHREAPAISRDPVADNTDLYAFVSPTIPARSRSSPTTCRSRRRMAGRTSSSSATDVRYRINIDNDGDGDADIIYEFAFQTQVANPNSFLYNTGPILSIDSANWNRKQFYSVTRISPWTAAGARHQPGLPAVQRRPAVDSGLRHAGRRGDPQPPRRSDRVRGTAARGFLRRPRVDLRPRQPAAVRSRACDVRPPGAVGRGRRQRDRQLQRPLDRAEGAEGGPDPSTARRRPTRRRRTRWSACGHRRAGRRRRFASPYSDYVHEAGEWMQVSRLGNPLFNEVLVGMGFKDLWNSLPPSADNRFLQRRAAPRARHAPARSVPGSVPEPRRRSPRARADLVAILLTGIPAGIVPGFQNFTGSTLADMLRLNMAIPPASQPEHPRADRRRPGRVPERPARVRRCRHGRACGRSRALTYPLVNKSYTPDGSGRRDHGRAHAVERVGAVSVDVPVPRDAAGRIPDRAARDAVSA